jgi:hypothetical protein
MKRWDAFISHASEDKAIVIALADALRAAGLRIWLDQQELRLGDSLREKIDEGLAQSRYGIVLLSPSFLGKRWPLREINGLFALEESGQKVILPVWHELDRDTLASYSPMLADRLAGNTARGVASVAADIVRIVVDPRSNSPASESPTLARRLIEILDATDDRMTLRRFLRAHPDIVARAAGGSSIIPDAPMGEFDIDLCTMRLEGTTDSRKWSIIQLASAREHPFPDGRRISNSLQTRIAELEALRRWVSGNTAAARKALPDFSHTFHGYVVAGRRSMLSEGDLELVRGVNADFFGITLRTYDWLVEAAVDTG